MRLIENVDLVLVSCRTVTRRIPQLPNLIDAAVRRRIDLDNNLPAFPALISVQLSHTSQGSAVARSSLPIAFRQFSAIARIRAIVVFPIPRCPLKMYPCAIRCWVNAFMAA